jgi:hypothetical protein
MNDSAIAGRLGVTDKTVAKAAAWPRRVEHRPNDEKDVTPSTLCAEAFRGRKISRNADSIFFG